MRTITVTGTVQEDVVVRTVQKKDGSGETEVATLKFYNRENVPVGGGKYEYKTLGYWEATVWGKGAPIWAKRFHKGDVVEVTGQLNFRTYQHDGETRVVLIVEGFGGGSANVEWVPKQFKQEDSQVDDSEVF